MRLWHELAGDGPPVVLVHEGICDARMWEPQWSSFPPAHRTVRLDLRGFGRSPIPPEPFSHAADVAELLDRLELGPAAIVGVSAGGLVALDLALARPDLVSALVLVGSALDEHEWSDEMESFDEAEEAALERGDLDLAVELNLRMWVDGPHRDPGEVDPALRGRVAEMQRRAFELQLAAGEAAEDELLSGGVAGRLGEVAVPTLVIVGELDLDDMQAIAARLEDEIPGADGARIDATAHVPSMERPQQFDRLVLGFLARL